MIMNGKKGVILGVANNKSIAYGIAKACAAQGAKIAFTYLNDSLKKRVEPIAAEFDSEDLVYPCDVSNPQEIKDLKVALERDLCQIDFIVHSIAIAPKDGLTGRFYDIPKASFDILMTILVNYNSYKNEYSFMKEIPHNLEMNPDPVGAPKIRHN